jgi:hypothetical protein
LPQLASSAFVALAAWPRHSAAQDYPTHSVTILVPFAKDAGKELVKTVGQIGVDKAKELAAWLKQRFAGDPVAAKDLSRFEEEPDKFEAGLESTIRRRSRIPRSRPS